ncbi:MAG: serine hydrolase domain-containing protein [Acidimicrobiales bacterium]
MVVGLVGGVVGCRSGGDRAGRDESQIIDEGPSVAPGGGRGDAGAIVTGDEGPAPTYPRVPFSRVDDELDRRVADAGLGGASLLVVQDGALLHRHDVGSVGPTTPARVGESARWFLAVVVAMLVDDGSLSLDDPVSRHLPELFPADGSGRERITVRQLLSHTSGLPTDLRCGGDEQPACDDALRATPLAAAPGEVFAVSAVDDDVLIRLVEQRTGRPWSEVATTRLLEPLGMVATTVDPGVAAAAPGPIGAPGPTAPSPAGTSAVPEAPTPDPPGSIPPPGGLHRLDAMTTGLDLSRFLGFVLARGLTPDGRRLVAERSVLALEHDETSRLDTAAEPWVAWTGIPTYGLGVWRDRLRGDDTAAMVSAAGRFGAYPFVDRSRNAFGVLVVDDRAGAGEAAVTASSRLVQGLVPPAVDSEGRPLRRAG